MNLPVLNLLEGAQASDTRRQERDPSVSRSIRSHRLQKRTQFTASQRNGLYPYWNRDQELPIQPGEKEPCGLPKSPDAAGYLAEFCRRRALNTSEDHTRDHFLFTKSLQAKDIPQWVEGFDLRFDISDLEQEEADELYRCLYKMCVDWDPAILLAKQPQVYPLFFDINIRGEAEATELTKTLDRLNFDDLCFFSHLARALQEIYLQPFTMAVFESHGICEPQVPEFRGESYARVSFHVVFPELIVQRGANCVDRSTRNAGAHHTRTKDPSIYTPSSEVNNHMLIVDHVRHYFEHACEGNTDPTLTAFWHKMTHMDNNNVWTEVIGENAMWHEKWDDLTGLRLAFTKKCNESDAHPPRVKMPWKAFCVTKEMHVAPPSVAAAMLTRRGPSHAASFSLDAPVTDSLNHSASNAQLHGAAAPSHGLHGHPRHQASKSVMLQADAQRFPGGYVTHLYEHEDLAPDSILWSRWGNVADPSGSSSRRSETRFDTSKLRRYQHPAGEAACFCLLCLEDEKYKKNRYKVLVHSKWEFGWKKYRDPVSEEVYFWRPKRIQLLQEDAMKQGRPSLARSHSSPGELSGYFDSPANRFGVGKDFFSESESEDEVEDEKQKDGKEEDENEENETGSDETGEDEEEDEETKESRKKRQRAKRFIRKVFRKPKASKLGKGPGFAVDVMSKLGKDIKGKIIAKGDASKKNRITSTGSWRAEDLMGLSRPMGGKLGPGTPAADELVIEDTGTMSFGSGRREGEGFWFHAPGLWQRQMDPDVGYFYWHMRHERYFWDP